MEYIDRFEFLVIKFLSLVGGSISRMRLTLGYDELDLDEVCYCVFHACVNPNSCFVQRSVCFALLPRLLLKVVCPMM